jgi:oligopeptide/dipeptide ABC transporter ATP-binding protein
VPLLEVAELAVSFNTPDGELQAVRGVSFEVEAGNTLGIVGESGSGKSVSTQTILGLNPAGKVSGQALFEGRDLLAMRKDELRKLRGAEIGMIFQDPLSSLHPYYKVGWQIVEMIRQHTDMSKRAARERAIELLDQVRIPQPDKRVDDYPYQFSGGMRQRAMIAMALALEPKLLIADEPTTALDVTVQAQIMELMQRLQRDSGVAIILITHDLGVIADVADEVMVMYAGKPMEQTDRTALYSEPHHPYTVGLLESLPRQTNKGERLKPISGQPPSLISPPAGCPFHPRCAYAMEKCRSEPPLTEIDAAHHSACWLPAGLTGFGPEADVQRRNAAGVAPAPQQGGVR